MITLKIIDDKEAEMELISDDYVSVIPSELQWRNWAADSEGMTGDALKDFVDNELFPGLQNLDVSTGNKRAVLIRDIFAGTNNYMKNGTIIRQVVNKLNEIDFNASEDRHMFGDIYEGLLRDLQSAGNYGEFYTPRAVTEIMTEIINPRLGEKVLDPACGTGGFLTSAIENIRAQDVHFQKYYTPDFLTKKQKINNGEVQQYYVENNHPAIIEPDTFEMVRLEMDRRLMLNGKYSGTDILTSRIKCGECGGSYGAKVWHSNDKYRKIMYQCNRKYSGKENCKTPAIRSDDIESRFVNVVNSMIENKDEIISNLERILDKICNKKGLSEEKEKLENSLAEQVEKIQELIEMNSRVAQNQEKYKK